MTDGKNNLLCGYLDNLVKRQNLNFLDVVANKDGKKVFGYGGGFDKSDRKRYFVFSCTKPIVSACILKLVEEGKLDVETPLSKYLPAFSEAFIIENGVRKKAGEMKIKHLLTMTSGLSYNYDTEPFREILAATDGKASTAEICEAFVKTPLLFNPGERFYYGLSFDVLGVVIEKVTGTPLDEYVKKTIFEPLGMFDSGFTRGDGEAENLKALYAKTADGITVKVKNANELVFSPYYLSGGAGVVSTTEDYMKFADCLTNGGKAANGYRLLKESSVKDMAKNHVGEISVNNGFTCVQGDDYAYGYGVRTRIKPLNFGLPVGEFGWDGAAGSYFMCDLKNRVTVYIGMCLMNWPATFKGEHLKIVKTIYDSLEI